MTQISSETVMELTIKVVSAFVARNPVPAQELPMLVESVYHGLARIAVIGATISPVNEEPKPAVRIKKSITDDYLICLEDGKKFKSLKRHLMSDYGLSPQLYREKWGLPDDYPMVAPAYAKSRSMLAKKMGFGRKGGAVAASDSRAA